MTQRIDRTNTDSWAGVGGVGGSLGRGRWSSTGGSWCWAGGPTVLCWESTGRDRCTELRKPRPRRDLPSGPPGTSQHVLGREGFVGSKTHPTQSMHAGNHKGCSGNKSMFCGILIVFHGQTHLENSRWNRVRQISFQQAFSEPLIC